MHRLIPLLVMVPFSAHAVLIGQIDTFDSSVANWSNVNSRYNTVTYVPGNGPGGAGDSFMQLSVSGYHLGASNKAQWTGNYLAAGISSIEMDLNYFAGVSMVNVRLLLWGNGGVWASSSTTPVSPGWNHYVFSLAPADLILVSLDVDHAFQGTGSGILNDTLSTVNSLLLRNDFDTPTIPGTHPPHITATMGVDNIEAVPEPATLAYLLLGGSGIYMARARRQTRLEDEFITRGWRTRPAHRDPH